LNEARPGASSVVEKLAEVLLVQVIRAHYAQQRRDTGLMAGLNDRRLARAFQVIHLRYADPLSLDDLAGAAGMSRSAFALHFKSVVDMTPMAYLTLWRLSAAHELLTFDGITVSQAACDVGYMSEVAFSRAFRRRFGSSPASVRRGSNRRL